MRVIAGTARSLKLKTIEGQDTRPTTDRIKETLFNMLQPDIPGASFLDLFSGSGAIAIEALSRGALEAVLVENSRAACACIRENLEHTRLAHKALLLECDCVTALSRLIGHKPFDIIFMDPPYGKAYEKVMLEKLLNSGIADGYTKIIFEASLATEIDFVEEMGYSLLKVKEYKTNKHVFVKKLCG
ncbi:MAG: 16S rRNA (guanine(966)-N(2))-methyltransferase RsmD [Alistipes sp.]|nr:16S rRNA (guanine(966)-N(2))-methyltransferase RsmD [Alistipes sp.]